MTISSLEELSAALDQASSGQVIEVEPSTLTTTLRWGSAVDGGSLDWNENVLVRPRLGERGSVVVADTMALQVKGVTLAGFHITGAVRLENAERTNLVWTTLGPESRTDVTGGDGVRLIELVRREIGSDGSSQMHNFRGNGGRHLRNVSLEGSWLNTNVGVKDNLQTLADPGGNGRIYNMTIEDSVLFTGWDKMFQMNHGPRGFTFRNNWTDSCSTTQVQTWHEGDRGSCSGGSNSINGKATDPVYEDNTVLGRIRQRDGGSGGRAIRNIARDIVDSTGEMVRTDNLVDKGVTAADYPPPAVPDLDEVWHP